MVIRKFDDLSDSDKAVYIVKEEIRKIRANELGEYADEWDRDDYILNGAFIKCIQVCDECLDVATLGEIEK